MHGDSGTHSYCFSSNLPLHCEFNSTPIYICFLIVTRNSGVGEEDAVVSDQQSNDGMLGH